jgi:hypothetical protein
MKIISLVYLASTAFATPLLQRRAASIQGSGTASYYGEGTSALGACGKIAGAMHVAISRTEFDPFTPNGNPNRNPLCGQCLLVTCTDSTSQRCNLGSSVIVEITDRCPGCPSFEGG